MRSVMVERRSLDACCRVQRVADVSQLGNGRPARTGPGRGALEGCRRRCLPLRCCDLQGLRQGRARLDPAARSEEHTSELQSLMRISYAVFCLKKKIKTNRE